MEVSLCGADREFQQKKLTAQETKQRYNREYYNKVASKKKRSKERIPKMKERVKDIDSI